MKKFLTDHKIMIALSVLLILAVVAMFLPVAQGIRVGALPTPQKIVRTATYVIAASNATALEKAQADVVATGTNDDLLIEAAATAGYYDIHLSSGNFVGGNINFAAYPIKLTGAGRVNTFYTAKNSLNGSIISASAPNYNSVIKDLALDGNGANQSSGKGIDLTNFYATTIDNVRIGECKTYGIYDNAASECVRITNVMVDNCGEGWYLYGASWYTIISCSVTDMYTNNNYGMSIENSFDIFVLDFTVDLATLATNTAAAGMVIYDSDRITVQNSRFFGLAAASLMATGIWVYVDGGVSDQIRLINNDVRDITAGATAAYYIQTIGAGVIKSIDLTDNIHTGTGGIGFNVTGPAGSIKGTVRGNQSVAATPFSILSGIAVENNIDYIAPGEVRTASGSLTAGNANAITFAWHDPEAQDILIKKVTVEITTPGGTALSVIQVGIADDATGTNLGSEFFTAIPANAAAILDSWYATDTGTQVKFVFCQDSASATDGWIVGKILTQNAASLAGKYYIEYVGK
jgi:hypothetical protein